ncbi:MAG: RimK family alpha-L-glutamate ligase [Desulfobacterales bacterium]
MSGAFRRQVIALEGRLRNCRNVLTLGVRPNFADYPPEDRRRILEAETVYYPSPFYADLLDACGKRIFPSYHTYKCVQDKIRQTALFQMLGIPHPRTRVYYGRDPVERIQETFRYPLIAKIPRGSALGRGVFFIENRGQLEEYCRRVHPAYIQEYLPIDRDIRVVVIGNRVVHAYWRVAAPGEYRTNIAAGGHVDLSPVPEQALRLARETARCCGFNDVGIDICRSDAGFCVLEANMKYGRRGFREAGIDFARLMERMIEEHEI